jgi:hypothetical protein
LNFTQRARRESCPLFFQARMACAFPIVCRAKTGFTSCVGSAYHRTNHETFPFLSRACSVLRSPALVIRGGAAARLYTLGAEVPWAGVA